MGEAAQDLPLDGGARGRRFPRLRSRAARRPCRLRLVHKSGRIQSPEETRLEAYDGAIPRASAKLPTALAAPAWQRRASRSRRPSPPVRVETIGTPPTRPRLSLVVAAGTPGPDPRPGGDARRRAGGGPRRGHPPRGRGGGGGGAAALEGCRAVFGLAGRLLTLPDGASPGRAAARGAGRVARAPSSSWERTPCRPRRDGSHAGRRRSGGGAPRILGATLLGRTAPSPTRAPGWGARTARRASSGAGRAARRRAAQAPEPADLACAECFGLNAAAVAAFRASDLDHPSVEVRLFVLARRPPPRRARPRSGSLHPFRRRMRPDRLAEAADAHAMAALRRTGGGA
jgi:hypothetical protein